MAYRVSLSWVVFFSLTASSSAWAQPAPAPAAPVSEGWVQSAPPPAPPATETSTAPGAAPQNSVQAPPAQGGQPLVTASEPPPPVIDLHPDPVPAPVPRTMHVHDGFYGRLSLGFGKLGTSIDVPGSGSALTATGETLALDLSLGYSPSPGIAVGGSLLFESLPSADFDDPSDSVGNASTLLVGPFFDGYPKARGGFHLGGAVGFAQDRLSRKALAGFRTANGFGIAGWVGYDFWVADEWSVGGLVRLMGTRGTADADATSGSNSGTANIATQSIHLMITALSH